MEISRKRAMYMAIVASAILPFLTSQTELVLEIDRLVYDSSMAQSAGGESDAPLALIKIDDATMGSIKDPLVLWPARFARAITLLTKAQVAVVAINVIPSVSLEPYTPGLDKALQDAIAQAEKAGTHVLFGYTEKPGAMEIPHEKFRKVSSGMGSLDLSPDPDGAIRNYLPCHTHGDGSVDPSIAYSAYYLLFTGLHDLDKLVKKPDKACEGKSNLLMVDYRRRIPARAVYSFADLLKMDDSHVSSELGPNLHGKVVFIGGTSAKISDTRPVPYNPYEPSLPAAPDVVIHLQTLQTLLSSTPLVKVEAFNDNMAAMALGVFLSLLMIRGSLAWVFAAATGLTAAWILAAFSLMGDGVVLSVWPPVAAALAAIPATGIFIYFTEYKIRSQLTRHFKSYVSQEVMEKILKAPDSVDFKGRLVYSTVMFADIRSFTTISEGLEPHQVVEGLNRYFTEMTAAITEAGGYVNKYTGDGIMAIFGAPEYDPRDGALAAVWGAVKMLHAAERLNKVGLFPGFPHIKMGIGLNSGEAIVGNIGCADKMDYSIIGDTVNTAARIEGLTKEYGIPLLMSESVYHNIEGEVEVAHLGSSYVKGKKRHIRIYTLRSIQESMKENLVTNNSRGEEKRDSEPSNNGEPVN
ncbi:MAG: adenylate/guanylate cyclase domain-containing protein [Nitrospinota bacterium]|nr:adenylate/guanylate cyclase domain-containing protein [Nitrospinota bacterium]